MLITESEGPSAPPNLYETDAVAYLRDAELGEEVIGPRARVAWINADDDMLSLARGLWGQLTVTLQMDDDDTALAQCLVPVVERKAGRLLVNGFPIGVEVADAMVHATPYPASTNFGATSGGSLSIRRFLRPVFYQNMPDALLPDGLAER